MRNIEYFERLKRDVLGKYQVERPDWEGKLEERQFKELSEMIKERMKGQTITPRTLRNHLIGDKNNLPRKDTLDILSQWATNLNWEEYKIKINDEKTDKIESIDIQNIALFLLRDIYKHPLKYKFSFLVFLGLVLWNPYVKGKIIKWFSSLNDWNYIEFDQFFWIITMSIFALEIFLKSKNLWKQAKSEKKNTTKLESPIKGLEAFNFRDAVVFRKLYRNSEAQNCFKAILNSEFKFGILIGESGCGKTSFLRAGLTPIFKEHNASIVIVKFGNASFKDSLKKAIKTQLKIKTSSKDIDIHTLLQESIHILGHTNLIVVIDQFEQYFSSNFSIEDRMIFINEIKDCQENMLSFKLLLTLRTDYVGNLFSLQQELNYTLISGHNYFKLENFTAHKAVKILKVMAEYEGLDFDEKFIQKIMSEEAARKIDNSVSAADLQILAFAIKNQKDNTLGFNQKSFQKIGGIEGLLQRYIHDQLETPNIYNREQTPLMVLLSFINREQNISIGLVSLKSIQEDFSKYLSKNLILSLLDWLVKLRLLVKSINIENEIVFELSHERLIFPILNLANKELSIKNRTNLLLEKRVGEWLDNKRKRKYLLNWNEYFQMKKYHSYLNYNKNEITKIQFLRLSKQKVWVQLFSILTIFFLLIGTWYIRQSTWYQLNWEIKNEIRHLTLNSVNRECEDDEDCRIIIIDSLVHSHSNLAFSISQEIDDFEKKNQALATLMLKIAENDSSIYQWKNYQEVLDTLAKNDTLLFWNIHLDTKVKIKSALAIGYAKLKNQELAKSKIDSLVLLHQVDGTYFNKHPLPLIVKKGVGNIKDQVWVKSTLEKLINFADKCNPRLKHELFLSVLSIVPQINDQYWIQSIIDKFIKYTEVPDEWPRYSILVEIVASLYQVKDQSWVQSRLNSLLRISQDVGYKHFTVKLIKCISERGDETWVKEKINEIITFSEGKDEHREKFFLLSCAAKLIGELEDDRFAKATLNLLVNNALELPLDYETSKLLSDLVYSIGKMQDTFWVKIKLKEIFQYISSDESENNTFFFTTVLEAIFDNFPTQINQDWLKINLEIYKNHCRKLPDYSKSKLFLAILLGTYKVEDSQWSRFFLDDMMDVFLEEMNQSDQVESLLDFTLYIMEANRSQSEILSMLDQLINVIGNVKYEEGTFSNIQSYAINSIVVAAILSKNQSARMHILNKIEPQIFSFENEDKKTQLLIVLAEAYTEDKNYRKAYELASKINSIYPGRVLCYIDIFNKYKCHD